MRAPSAPDATAGRRRGADLGTFATHVADVVIADVSGLEERLALEHVAGVGALAAGSPFVILTDTTASALPLTRAIANGANTSLVRDLQNPHVFTFRLIVDVAAMFTAKEVCRDMRDSWLRDLVFNSVSSVCWNQRVPDIIQTQSLSRRRLQRQLAVSRLHSAKNLQLWARLLVASWILSRRWRLIRDLALDLGWADDGGLASAAFERLGLTPRNLYGVAGFERTKNAFLEVVGLRHHGAGGWA